MQPIIKHLSDLLKAFVLAKGNSAYLPSVFLQRCVLSLKPQASLTSTISIPLLCFGQGHGTEEAQAVCSHKEPEGVESPVGKHDGRQECNEDIPHLGKNLMPDPTLHSVKGFLSVHLPSCPIRIGRGSDTLALGSLRIKQKLLDHLIWSVGRLKPALLILLVAAFEEGSKCTRCTSDFPDI